MSRLLAACSLLLASGPALACTSCFDPKQPDTNAFLGPTIFMSLLPLAMLGSVAGFVWWRVRAVRSAAAEPPLPFRPPGDPALP